jgi:hypothetical protein
MQEWGPSVGQKQRLERVLLVVVSLDRNVVPFYWKAAEKFSFVSGARWKGGYLCESLRKTIAGKIGVPLARWSFHIPVA